MLRRDNACMAREGQPVNRHPVNGQPINARAGDGQPVNRYMLIPRARVGDGASGPVRRFSLARVGVSPRSALGEDRHERLERAATPRRD